MRNLRITNNEIPHIKDIESQYQRDLELHQLTLNRSKYFASPDFDNHNDGCEFIFSLFFPSLTKYC